MADTIKIVVSGIGNRALPKNLDNTNWHGWVELIKRSKNFELVGAHDISEDSIKRITEREYLDNSQTYTDLDKMLDEVSSEAILVANPAENHEETIKKALDHDLHVLVEKPFVRDLSGGKTLIEQIEQKERTVAVIQNWRSKDVGRILYEKINNNSLGDIGHIFFRYIRDRENPNYPDYIKKEQFPLLYAMGIHHLDLFRYVLQDEFVSVMGNSFKPPWTIYESDSGLNLFLKTSKGVTVVYTGTISSRNRYLEQENLVIEGDFGTLYNESPWLEPPLWFLPKGSKEKEELTGPPTENPVADQYNKSDIFILEDFYQAVSQNKTPMCSGKDGLQSIAVLEASRRACESGSKVEIERIM